MVTLLTLIIRFRFLRFLFLRSRLKVFVQGAGVEPHNGVSPPGFSVQNCVVIRACMQAQQELLLFQFLINRYSSLSAALNG
jgi:hypothetical protein